MREYFMSLIDIIIPCFNEEKNIPLFYKNVNKALKNQKLIKNLSYNYLFVDDGSNDKTLEVLKKMAECDDKIKFISFSRNFGKESAIYAGLENSFGDYVVIMDVDLQDPPELIPKMYYDLINEEYDSVATRRVSRKGEPILRSFFARSFYKIINKISKIEIVDGARDYRMMTRQMANSVLQLNEYNRFSKGIFAWVGFKTKWIEYENIERSKGESKWSIWKLFLYSINGIIAFSTIPLSISTFVGVILSISSFFLILVIILKTIFLGDAVPGWPSIICAILFIGGIQLFSIGILGQYLSKTYTETKNRPIYIQKETNI